MTSKERILAALNLEKPDRLPVTVHQWQKYHLDKYMNGMSDIEAFEKTGLDAAVTILVDHNVFNVSSDDWKVEKREEAADGYTKVNYEITTPGGVLTGSYGFNAITVWDIDHVIKNDEDMELLKYRPLPRYDKEYVSKVYDRIGDKGILRVVPCGSQGGCWQEACNLYGTEQLIFKTFDDPDWVHGLLEFLMEEKFRFIEEELRGLKVDLVETGGGASSNTVISPDMHAEFCMPYDKRMHDAMRRAGLKSVYHTCGGMTKILDSILDNNCDASETLSPPGVGGDIVTADDEKLIVEKLGGKIALIGGLDQHNILTDGTPDDISREVKRLFEVFGKAKGYILSASDHFFEAPPENLEALARAGLECAY